MPAAEICGGNGGKQCLGVGMQRTGKQSLAGRVFHNIAHVHHHDVVADVAHHAQVVGDEHVRHAPFLLQIHEQIQNLGLDGYVQGRNGLIAHDELGIHGQRPGQSHPLPLPTVQLMGVHIHIAVGQTAHIHQLAHPFAHLFPAPD